jgi:hypothetical protein
MYVVITPLNRASVMIREDQLQCMYVLLRFMVLSLPLHITNTGIICFTGSVTGC